MGRVLAAPGRSWRAPAGRPFARLQTHHEKDETVNHTRTIRTRALAGAAVIAAGAAGAIAVAATSGATAEADELVVFDPRSELVEHFVDLADEGFSTGDIVLEYSDLVDPTSGDAAGRTVTRVNVLEGRVAPSEEDPVGDFMFYLDCTYEGADGNIVFAGSEEHTNLTADGLEFGIVGGTGSYAGVTGTVTVAAAEVDGQAGAMLTFALDW
jgi:hypothetical protein